ncbi:unnamed protein product, partial [Meganyctiphanes norvegica]
MLPKDQDDNRDGEAFVASSIYWAASKGVVRHLDFFLAVGDCNIDHLGFGTSPLMGACWRGQPITAKLLLYKGANVFLRTTNNLNALSYALNSDNGNLTNNEQRQQLVLSLLLWYPIAELEAAIREVEATCPGLINHEQVSYI